MKPSFLKLLTKRRRRKRFLLVCWYDTRAYGTIIDHINSFTSYSRHEIVVENLFGKNLQLHRDIKLSHYDGIIFHNTISYNVDNVRNLHNSKYHDFKNYRGVKVLMKQDECLRTNKTISLLSDWHFNLLLTCVKESELAKVYPKKELPNLNFFTTLTGYITHDMRSLQFDQNQEKICDVVYRGMKLPYFFGQLAWEKYEIGERFKKYALANKLQVNISSRIEDRVFGADWLRFLGTSKAVLAVESGASIFDFTGELEAATEEYVKNNPQASFEEVQDKFLKKFELNVHYNQVSPRHFEAASTKTLQIMYEGEYSNIFIPNVHYLPLKKDFSNIDSVISLLKNKDYRYEVTERAHRDIIMNDDYLYESFIKNFDAHLMQLM